MLRKNDPAFKKAVDDSIVRLIESGELARLHDKWFMQPIPPMDRAVGLPVSSGTRAAWSRPNDEPMERYVDL
jgi:glutamate/aspartate transport system substrate-binding protein